MKPIILASASPRRQEICTLLGLTFTVIPAQNETEVDPTLPVEQAIVQVARGKAEEVAAIHPDTFVLGADTTVIVDGEVLGKPHDAKEAKAMLRHLSGRTHQVVTGVWLSKNGGGDGFADVADVVFGEMTEAEIEEYVNSGEPMDKAGAYGIQGCGMRYIDGIRGDFYTVMGLPAGRLYRFLKEWL